MTEIEINPQFGQVLEFVNKTSCPIFLTGKAGTGKTTLLKYIRENTYKQMAVCAPTGVAAINAGGSTIHSFFQFPFTPFIPRLKQDGDIDESASNLPTLKYSSQRLSIFRSLELLVIDEISMVRADLLDQIDITLRVVRKRRHLPFGGVQLLLIGDMHQLSPVAQAEEWRMLQPHYKSPYFFDSYVMRKNPAVYIELTKVYRQSDQAFVDLLNKVRHNALDREAHAILNSRYRRNLSQAEYAGNITLTTHNRKADEINAASLKALPGKLYTFGASVKGNFPEKNYPASEKLQLKAGARVMFLKNNPEKNYYNGKTGIVSSITEEKIRVKCDEDDTEISLEKEVWNNVAYKIDKATHHIEEEVLGTFTQFPLRHAWAITIHKSQGLTFDKVIIDAAEAFSAGQVYVALSRCRSLEGLTLSSQVSEGSLKNDGQVLNFASGRPHDSELGSILHQARSGYLRNILYDVFDLTGQIEMRRELAALLQLHDHRLDSEGKTWLRAFLHTFDNLVSVDAKFRSQLKDLAESTSDPEENDALQERVRKAATYFANETDNLCTSVKNCRLVTESQEAANDFNEVLQTLFESLFVKKELLKACEGGFRFDAFLKARLSIVFPPIRINIYGSPASNKETSGVAHVELYRELLQLRDEICREHNKPIYMVANAASLKELAAKLPTGPEQLLQIKGFGKARVEAYGDLFLELIRTYCAENNIFQVFDFKPPGRKKERNNRVARKSGTKQKSIELFRQGMSPERIAEERNLSVGTIMSHLLPFVVNGEIGLERLVSGEKQELINEALKGFQKEKGLSHLKNLLPEYISYHEIEFMLAYAGRLSETPLDRAS